MATRGLVVATKGVAATSQPLATSAALAVLAQGGTFADAAIAASAVISVVEPWNSHLGGDAFLIVHEAKTRQNVALNASGAAPSSATRESYGETLGLRGPRAATVPGLVDCWFALHSRYGSLPMAQLLQPAIGYAHDGYPAGPRAVLKFADGAPLFAENPTLHALGVSGPVALGTVIRQPELAWSLEQIAHGGRDAFYTGPIADRIVAASGGHFTHADLAAHHTRILAPLSVRYRHLTVHCQPPPSQGMILAQELALANGFPIGQWDEAQRTHVLVECKKRAFADRFRHLADPEWHAVPLDKLLADPYLAQRRAEIGERASEVQAGQLDEGQDTTYFLVADRWGNAVSFIQSVFHNFGSAWIPDGTGILFNNRLTGFSLDPAAPNYLQPGKRPAHTLNAWLATDSQTGALALVGGTPGANVQVQTNLQLIVNAVDLGLDPQEAVERPRWQHSSDGGNTGQSEDGLGVLELESRAESALFTGLAERGHTVQPLAPWGHGSSAQMLAVLESGAYAVGSDPRCDGHAAGL